MFCLHSLEMCPFLILNHNPLVFHTKSYINYLNQSNRVIQLFSIILNDFIVILRHHTSELCYQFKIIALNIPNKKSDSTT